MVGWFCFFGIFFNVVVSVCMLYLALAILLGDSDSDNKGR